MYIQTKSVEISFHDDDVNRLRDIIYAAKRGIEQSIKEHYIRLQGNGGVEEALRVFHEQCDGKIRAMQDISNAVNGPYNLAEDLEKFLKEEYSKKDSK